MAGKTHPDYIDFLMSEKFGTDWKFYEAKRMDKFVRILLWESERSRKENNKGKKPAQKFRSR